MCSFYAHHADKLCLEAMSAYFPLSVHRTTFSSFTVMVTTEMLRETQQCSTASMHKLHCHEHVRQHPECLRKQAYRII